MPRQPKYPCPFSPSRLQELYWREGLSIADILRAAIDISAWATPPSSRVAERWLQAANITRRNPSEAGRLNAAKQRLAQKGIFSPECRAGAQERARARHAPLLINGRIVQPAPAGSGPKSKAVRNKISRTKQAQRTPDYWREGQCAHCQKPVRRPAWRSKGASLYCNRECAAAHLAAKKRAAIALMTRPCDQCGTPITRRPSQFKASAFCSKSCANTYRAARNPDMFAATREQQSQGGQAVKARKAWLLEADRNQRKRHTEQTGEVLLDAAQAAAILEISVKQLYNRVRDGKIIPASRKPRMLFNGADLP